VQTLQPENFCFKFNDFHQPVRFIYFLLSSLVTVTASKDKLSQEEKIERAYLFREGTGLLEEDKQASEAETFQPDDKAKEKV